MNKKENNLPNFSLFVSSFLMFITAIFVYGFFGLLLEVISYVSFGMYDVQLSFTGIERRYFNVFLAGLSLLFGLQGGLQYLLTRINMRLNNIVRIQHKGRLLIWITLLLTIKLYAIVLFNNTLFFEPITPFIPFSLLCFVMLLIIVVLFFYAWSPINRYLFNNKPKTVYYGVGIFLILSLGLAQFEMIDMNGLRKQILNQNVVYTSGIEYPKSEISQVIKKKVLVRDFVIAKNPNSNEIELFHENTRLSLHELSAKLKDIRSNYRKEEQDKIRPGFRIDKNILLKELLPIFEHFYMNQMYWFTIYVESEIKRKDQVISYRFDPGILNDFLKNESRELLYPQSHSKYRMPPRLIEGYFPTEGGIDIYSSKKGSFIDNEELTVNLFTEKLEETKNVDYQKRIHYCFVDINMTFGQYILMKSKLFKAYDLIREEYALNHFNMQFHLLSKTQYKTVRKLYPLNLKEFGLNALDQLRMEDFFKEHGSYNPYYECVY